MVGTSGRHLRTRGRSFTGRREGGMPAEGCVIQGTCGKARPPRRASAPGEQLGASLNGRQDNPWIPLAIKASDASSITTVAVQPIRRKCVGSENSFTMAAFADMIINITISGTATTPLITAD